MRFRESASKLHGNPQFSSSGRVPDHDRKDKRPVPGVKIESETVWDFRMSQRPDLQQLRAEVSQVMDSIKEFDEKIEERNRERLRLIEELRGLLPPEQFKRFETIITKTIDAVKPAPDPRYLPPLEIDEQHPLESLRKIRCQIAQEVCAVMGVEPVKI
jgi:hypothetical protein